MERSVKELSAIKNSYHFYEHSYRFIFQEMLPLGKTEGAGSRVEDAALFVWCNEDGQNQK